MKLLKIQIVLLPRSSQYKEYIAGMMTIERSYKLMQYTDTDTRLKNYLLTVPALISIIQTAKTFK